MIGGLKVCEDWWISQGYLVSVGIQEASGGINTRAGANQQ
jgi:hypothetical protein